MSDRKEIEVMTEAVTMQVSLEWLLDLMAAARESAEDHQSLIDGQFPGRTEDVVQARRHARESSVPQRVIDLLDSCPIGDSVRSYGEAKAMRQKV